MLTQDELNAIRMQLEKCEAARQSIDSRRWLAATLDIAEGVPALLAHIDGLQAEIDRWHAEWHEKQWFVPWMRERDRMPF